jgi:hypothetical protein
MADGYITQSRKIPFTNVNHIQRWTEYFPERGITPYRTGTFDLNDLFSGLQTTYSYRSGRRGPGLDPEQSALGKTPSTLAGEFGFIKELDKATGNDRNQWDNGHEFNTITTSYSGLNYGTGASYSGYPASYYRGPVIPFIAGGIYTGFEPPDFPDAQFYGARAIFGTIPDKPGASLAQQLGQILQHSYFPSFSQVKKIGEGKRVTYLPDNYVNYEFGLKPFLNDAQSLVKAVYEAQRLIDQYKRDGGKQIRRKMEFPETHTTERYSYNFWNVFRPPGSLSLPYWYPDGYPGTVHVDKSTEIKFTGAYVYKLPDSVLNNSYMINRAELVKHLLGLKLTEKDVWDLTPWSWLADWKFNLGTVIGNAAALADDSLVIKYGYLQVKQTWKTTVQIAPLYDDNHLGYTCTSVRKQRFRSSPYGFGMNPASFSDTQWAILSALGLTKAWKYLH